MRCNYKPFNKYKVIPPKYALFKTINLPFWNENEENNDLIWIEQRAHKFPTNKQSLDSRDEF